MSERTLLAREIIELCLDINGIGGGNKKENGKTTAMCWLMGHTGTIQVDIHYGGWEPDVDPDEDFFLGDFSKVECFLDCIETLESIKAAM